MEETRTQLIMVTEAIFASSQDLLSRFEGLPGSRKPVKLSELEVKAGLLQVCLNPGPLCLKSTSNNACILRVSVEDTSS